MNHREMMRRRLGADGRQSPGKSVELAGDAARPAVELRIEHLVLEGFSPADRHGIADSLQSELTRLLSEQGLPPGIRNLSELEQVNGGSISLDHGGRAAAVGSRIAHAVQRGFTGSDSKHLPSGAAAPTNYRDPAKR